jgi:hypothetical protein
MGKRFDKYTTLVMPHLLEVIAEKEVTFNPNDDDDDGAANPVAATALVAAGVGYYGLSKLAPTEQERLAIHIPKQRKQIEDNLARKGFGELDKNQRAKAEEKLKELAEEEKALIEKAKEAEKRKEERRTDHFSRYMESNSLPEAVGAAGAKRESAPVNTEKGTGGNNAPKTSSTSPIFQGQTGALLALIGRAEGAGMGYDAANKGKAGDMKKGYPGLSGLTVHEVMKLQSDGEIFAAGMYQIIPKTLAGLMAGNYGATGVKGTDIFNAATQDKLTATLIDYRIARGGGDRKKTQKELAAEFASIPDPDTEKSRYDGKAGNKASITSAQIQAALGPVNTSPDVMTAQKGRDDAQAAAVAAEKAKEAVAAAKPLFTQDDLTALANALKSQSMTGGGMTTAALVSKATPYERDFYMGVVRTNAL